MTNRKHQMNQNADMNNIQRIPSTKIALAETQLNGDDKIYESYGFRITQKLDDKMEEVIIQNISIDKKCVLHLATTLEKYQASILSVYDIMEDFLVDFEI